MAKKNKKDKKDGAQAEAVDSIRAAIERGLQLSAEGAQATRERTRELVDEIASAAGRVRQSFEDMRVLDELRRLRNEVEALGARVSALERPSVSATSPAAAAKPATSRASRSRAKKSTAARKTTSPRRSAAKKATTSPRSRAKKATTAAKPASSPSSSGASATS
jgi:hypothetical protein